MRLKEGGVTLDSTLTEFLVVHLYLHVVDALDEDEPGVYLGVELDGDSCYLVSILLRRSQHVAKVLGLLFHQTFDESELAVNPRLRLETRHEVRVIPGRRTR